MAPRNRNRDPYDPSNAVTDMYDGLGEDAPTGDSNVPLHPWQEFDFAEDDAVTDPAEYDDDQE